MNLLQRVKRFLAEAPKAISYAVGTSGKNNYFSPQTRNKAILEKYRTIYRQGGIPAQAIDTYALFMLSPGIILVSDDEAAKEAVQTKLFEMDIERLLWLAITRSLNFGDSFQEIVRFKTGGGISRIVHRSPVSFSILTDERGDLQGYEQETELGNKIPLPTENIIHLALIPDDDLYGISLTGRAFDDVIRDTKTCDGIATGIERHGTGKHHWILGNAEQTVTADDIKAWKDKLQTLKADSDIVTSHLFQCVDLDRGGIPNAQQYSDVFLQRMCASYGVPGELLGLRIGTTDATAVTRIDAFFRQIQTFQATVARAYQPIVDKIVGQPGIVRLTFGDASPKDEKQRAEWITMLMNANKLDPFWVGETWLREQFDLPDVEESVAPLPRESSCRECGGPGSGNWGHAGIPGQVGGSAAGSGGTSGPLLGRIATLPGAYDEVDLSPLRQISEGAMDDAIDFESGAVSKFRNDTLSEIVEERDAPDPIVEFSDKLDALDDIALEASADELYRIVNSAFDELDDNIMAEIEYAEKNVVKHVNAKLKSGDMLPFDDPEEKAAFVNEIKTALKEWKRDYAAFKGKAAITRKEYISRVSSVVESVRRVEEKYKS